MPEVSKIFSWEGFTTGGLAINLLSSVLYPLLALSVGYIIAIVGRFSKTRIGLPHYIKNIAVALVSMLVTVVFIYYSVANIYVLLVSCALSVALFNYFTLKPLADIGIFDADKHVASGIGYVEALNMCGSRLYLLGTSGAKLTSLAEFSKAIQRCNTNSNEPTVRFLLSRPDNELLISAARQAGENPSAYVEKSKASLRNLARLRRDFAFNFEVRFYKSANQRDFPHFRLMFINDSTCLVSYNVYGKGDGSRQPQIVIKKGDRSTETDNFYFVFRSYFDRIWEDADRWDYEEYAG